MKLAHDRLTLALQATTREDVLQALSPRRHNLSPTDIVRLTQHLCGLPGALRPVKIALLRTYTTELLQPYWTFEAMLHGFAAEVYQGAFGVLLQELRVGSALSCFTPDLTYCLLRWEDLHPRLVGTVTAFSAHERATVQAETLDYAVALLHACRRIVPGLLVIAILPLLTPPALGMYDVMMPDGEATFFRELKTRLTARVREEVHSAYLCDLDNLALAHGRDDLFDARLWHSAHFPFSTMGSQAVVEVLMRYAVAQYLPRVKCLVLDADNTLWGGIVGEEGLEGIQLGPEYPGSVYQAFQRRLLALQGRGLLLALCSKNNETDVLHVLREHAHQLLREEHFAAFRINWDPKPDNLRALADELSLGLESLLLVDDSPFECQAVRVGCPQVRVRQTPPVLLDLPGCLDYIPQLEILRLTDEDRRRTALYAGRRHQHQFHASAVNLEEYLASLQMVMTVGRNDRKQVARIAQLTQKTNQFNLTTRRYSESEIVRMMDDADWLVAHFRLADIFSDHGLVGVALVRGLSSAVAEIDVFLISCRVIGRKAETIFLRHLLADLGRQGCTSIRAYYFPTAKNIQVANFWGQHGFSTRGDGVFELNLTADRMAADSLIRVELE